MEMTLFWVIAPGSLVEVYRRFRVLAASIIVLMMEAASTSETSVHFYHTKRGNNPEDSHLRNVE
jgi:hypothetical protein